jgi:hypothetical protein
MPLPMLSGDSISISSQSVVPTQKPVFLVTYKDFSVWSIPVEECETWFQFISHFWEFWPNDFRFTYAEMTVKPQDWQRVWNTAKRTRFTPLTFSLVSFNPKSIKPVKLPLAKSTPASHSRNHVLTWLHVTRNESNTISLTDKDSIQEDLQSIDTHLSSHSKASVREEYNQCTEATRVDISKLLENQAETLKDPKILHRSEKLRIHNFSLDIVGMAEVLFQIFLPLNFEGPSIAKFWGAVYRLLKVEQAQISEYV